MGNLVSFLQPTPQNNLDQGHVHVEKRGVSEPYPCHSIPISEPTQSFWTYPPSAIATHRSSNTLPEHADVVIIGSGISGASFARTLLDVYQQRYGDSDPLHVVMLEAQETCSGATGRNGGHINPPLFHDYEDLVQSLGEVAAQQIIRFRLAHLDVLPQVAVAEAADADCRRVDSIEVFFNEAVFEEAKRKLRVYMADMPQEASTYRVWESADARETFNLSSLAIGCITTRAGAVHPYRFITAVLSRLLEAYPKSFQLFTRTPCTSIAEPTPDRPFYSLTTPHGRITASHVVHLTNAWVGGLVPKLAAVVHRIRETMSAQRPGKALQFDAIDIDGAKRKDHGHRAYIFYDSPEQKDYDYLTQLSDGEHELMFGGGREPFPETDAEVCRPGTKGMYDMHSAAHVSGALPIYFGAHNWGAEAVETRDADAARGPWAAGRVKALWSGLLSESVDAFPWVGRIPREISGRRSSAAGVGMVVRSEKRSARLADPGEWVAAGYTSEGMVNAWLCSRAVALMVLGLEDARDVDLEGEYGAGQTVEGWLPARYRISESRWRDACRAWNPKGVGSGTGTVRLAGRRKIYQHV